MIHMRWLAGKTEEWRVFKQRKTKFQELCSRILQVLVLEIGCYWIVVVNCIIGLFIGPIDTCWWYQGNLKKLISLCQ